MNIQEIENELIIFKNLQNAQITLINQIIDDGVMVNNQLDKLKGRLEIEKMQLAVYEARVKEFSEKKQALEDKKE